MANINVAKAPIRRDAHAKILGQATYVDDLQPKGVLFGATIRTRLPGGRVESVRLDPDWNWSEYILVVASDIPGKNAVKMLDDDQPILVDDQFRHAGEPVMLLAHRDRKALHAALSHVKIEEVPCILPVFNIDDALASDTPVIPHNVYSQYLLQKGDLLVGEGECDVFVELRSETSAQEQLYIEPQGMIAQLLPDGRLRVEGSMQCPYYVLDALRQCLGWEEAQIQVVQTTTGGAFGGKEDYPSVVACHAALLALKAEGQPVKIVYERSEDLRVTPKRHPSRTLIRLGATREGELCLIDIDFAIDGGAYRTLSPVVLSRGVIHAPGPYHCANVRVLGRAVFTNHPPFGAFRGFGAPQSILAMEIALDQLAVKLGMDPVTLRRKNLLRPGLRNATNDVQSRDCFALDVLDVALARSKFDEKQAAYACWNQQAGDTRRGIGLACFAHGAGFTGNGEVYLASRLSLTLLPDGMVEILCSNTEMGQGAATTLPQIAAEELGVPLEYVRFPAVDTSRVPNSGPTVASRTCMVVGGLVAAAAKKLRNKLEERGLDFEPLDLEQYRIYCAALCAEMGGELRVSETYQAPIGMVWDEKRFQGRAYASFAWACYVAEVEVDMTTLETRVLKITAVQEIGKAVNARIAQGQIEGGVVQGIGWALFENIVWNKEGNMANDRLTNYTIPTSADIPEIDVVFLEKGLGAGPNGAKGIGELPMDGPAPAILNALHNALGITVAKLPASPELLLRLFQRNPESV
ncbi:xanthine dehydrogenase family protein (plasmid) [Acidithiobacillus caldus]|uniref:Xanthine dehydrogenase n=3 Tax=Acidithiobacillus caldus TaxID=33059 RepID=F9ZUK4_ACICS|nr:xanthine dehydrogenase family protein molybdopterin-binding subunit [Acidithiobacillus caldus]AEK59551.1 Xanthine dehydrogenase [Acidithiobacillus caldus SM-1]AUW34120.1 xanthine dehydrogenase family protein [Acidithiobacillus caldus]